MALTTAQIQAAYVTFFNRPADVEGLNYWSSYAGSPANLYATFAQSKEYNDTFANLSQSAQVNAVYKNLFGREAEAAGLNYWVGKVANGEITLANLALALAAGAQTTDLATYNNRVTAATAFTKELDTTAEILAYQGTAANAVAKTWLSNVKDTAASLEAATTKSAIDAAVTSMTTAATGNTYTLTAGAEVKDGGTGNDTFAGVQDTSAAPAAGVVTFDAADIIDGKGGVDTLKVTVQGNGGAANLAAATVSNVEVISVRNVSNGAITVDGANFLGETEFVSDRSIAGLVFNNIEKADVTVVGNQQSALGAVTIDVGAASVTDAFVLNIKDGANSATLAGTNPGGNLNAINVNDDDANWTEATINSTGAANFVGNVGLSGTAVPTTHTVKTLTINAATNLTTGAITGFSTTAADNIAVNISGAATSVNIGALAAAIDVVDASGLTAGGLTATLDNTGGVHAATAIKVTGGKGNDVITSDGILLADGSFVAAGEGAADRLVLTTAIANDTAGKASAARYTGFEQLQVNNGVSQDASIFTGSTIGAVRISDGGAATQVSNLSATQAANVSIVAANAAGAITIGVKDASNAGQTDTVKAVLTTTNAAGAAQSIDLAGLVLTGVEKLELTGNGTAAASTGAVTLTTTAATSLDSIKLANVGNGNSITIAAGQVATNLVVDATGSGNTTIDARLYNTTTGASLTGGAGNDTIQGTQRADVIVAGAGDDVVWSDNATSAAVTARVQQSNLTFAANYDAGDVVTVTFNGTAYSHTVTAGAQTGEAVYDALKAVVVDGTSLQAAMLASTAVIIAPADLAANAAALNGTANAAFTVTTSINNDNDVAAAGAFQTITPTGFETTEVMTLTIGGNTYSVTGTGALATDLATFVTDHAAAISTASGGTVAVNGGGTALVLTSPANATGTATAIVSNAVITGGDLGTVALATTTQTAPTNQTAPAFSTAQTAITANTTDYTAGTNVSDTITLGDGKDDVYFFGGNDVAVMDTITDLNLGTDTAAGEVDELFFEDNFAGTLAKATLTDAQQLTVTGKATLGDAFTEVLSVLADGNVGTFTYGGNTYVAYDGATYDYIVKVTGVVGTLDVSDINLIA